MEIMEGEKRSSRMFIVNMAQLGTLLLNFAAIIWFAASLSAATNQNVKDITEVRAQVVALTNVQTDLIRDGAATKAILSFQTQILNDIKDTVNSQSRRK